MPFEKSIWPGLIAVSVFVLLCFVFDPRLRAWIAFHRHRINCTIEEATAPIKKPRFTVTSVDFGPDDSEDEFRPELDIDYDDRFMRMTDDEATVYRRERLRRMGIAHERDLAREDEAWERRQANADPLTEKS